MVGWRVAEWQEGGDGGREGGHHGNISDGGIEHMKKA